MYSFSNDTSFSDFYNFPEESSELSVEPVGEDKESMTSRNSMEEAAKNALGFRYLPAHEFKKTRCRLQSGKSKASRRSRRSKMSVSKSN